MQYRSACGPDLDRLSVVEPDISQSNRSLLVKRAGLCNGSDNRTLVSCIDDTTLYVWLVLSPDKHNYSGHSPLGCHLNAEPDFRTFEDLGAVGSVVNRQILFFSTFRSDEAAQETGNDLTACTVITWLRIDMGLHGLLTSITMRITTLNRRRVLA